MFLGHYVHSLESKGRLAIPAKFRYQLGKKPIVTRGLDGCLFLVPQRTWKKVTDELRTSPLTKQDTREFIRLMAHDAAEVNYDAQGRMLVPQSLRHYANLKNAVVVAGSLDWVEIWDQTTYHQKVSQIERNAAAVAERLSQTRERTT
ncbi:MAG: division/cell wall cluster transcriptional repressor MraZ [Candidatus Chisholmbacteria bacterium]|nr:division/cell wall cluster transcriptional repressor MraZ [Candidatus Chisholmbacteria bacterium]